MSLNELYNKIWQAVYIHCGEDYDKTCDYLYKIQFTDVNIENNAAEITTRRPGILIGNKGRLAKKLQQLLSPWDLKIIEKTGVTIADKVVNQCNPEDYPDDDFDWDYEAYSEEYWGEDGQYN